VGLFVLSAPTFLVPFLYSNEIRLTNTLNEFYCVFIVVCVPGRKDEFVLFFISSMVGAHNFSVASF